MILVDTSVWVDHLRQGNSRFVELLKKSDVMMHPWVIGELGLGNMRNRVEILRLLAALPQAPVVSNDELLQFISSEKIYGRGIGLVDAHLLASTHAIPGTLLWTRDRRLAEMADRLKVSYAHGLANL